MAPCLLAPWRHQSGGDSHRSFGVSVKERSRSIFHCFTCGSKGTLAQLTELIADYTGEDYEALISFLEHGEELGPPATGWRDRAQSEYDVLAAPISPDWLMVYQDPFRHAAAIQYLANRGIDEKTCNRLQLRYDSEERRILFPVFDTNGDLHGFTGRAINADIEPRVKDYQGLRKRLLLLGGQFIPSSSKVVICEGLFDYAKLQQAGVKGAVAAMFAGLTDHQVRILTEQNKPVVLFYDNDDAGRRAATHAHKMLHKHVPVLRVTYPGKRKDPADYGNDELLAMVASAEF
jgi:DNA primase